MNIHQILPTFTSGDAIGNEVILLQKILRCNGYNSEVFCESYNPAVNAIKYTEYPGYSLNKNILIYHHSIGSEIAPFIANLPDQKIMIYHNITPAHYYEGINDYLVPLLKKGREETQMLASHIKLALGDSEYNRRELEETGYQKTDILPIIIDFCQYPSPCPSVLSRYSDAKTNILFVGRIAPNKRYEDIITIFYYYKKMDSSARLLLPGTYRGTEIYLQKLQDLVTRLHLTDVYFLGEVSFDELVAYYHAADLYLCMSEHEGFNVPLVECMYYRIPIIAYKACAIPSTIGDAGILVNEKRYEEIAEAIHLIITEPDLKKRIIQSQLNRIRSLQYDVVKNKFLKILTNFINAISVT